MPTGKRTWPSFQSLERSRGYSIKTTPLYVTLQYAFDWIHYGDGIMGTMVSQITSLTTVYSTVYSDADQRKHQSSASLAFVRPVNSPHKWQVTRKMFPFDDVIMYREQQWRSDGSPSVSIDGVSNHQPHHCLLNRLFRRRSEKTSKLRVTGLCEGNSPVISEFPAQRASNAENVSIWWFTLYGRETCRTTRSQHFILLFLD